MLPTLYSIDASPPCRAVIILAKAIGLDLNIKHLNLLEDEHLRPEFLKINPQHTVPTLDDDGFILSDSHAINLYLLEKYGKVDCFYSRDLKTKALTDQRIHFDSGVAFGVLFRIAKPIKKKETKIVPENLKHDVEEIYGFLNTFLEGNDWVCGNRVTVADIHLMVTITAIEFFVPMKNTYSNVRRWLKNCKEQPWYEVNIKGSKDFEDIFTSFIKDQ